MRPENLAVAHRAERVGFVEDAADYAASLWRQIDPGRISDSWMRALPELFVVVSGAQLASASAADAYVTESLAAQNIASAAEAAVNPRALAGVASDGRDLASLLYEPAVATLSAIGSGIAVDTALATGYAVLDMITRTQVSDAGRVADQVATMSRPNATGYVRMVVGKTCSRCIVLAGKWYAVNTGFDRHPRCDCVHIPSRENIAGDLRTDPNKIFASMTRAEQDKVFTKAGAEAIRDGADIGQVVNARSGMSAAGLTKTGVNSAGQVVNVNRRTLSGPTTTAGTTRRGFAGQRLGPGAKRLTPERIYEVAGEDRDEALRLLYEHGYLVAKPAVAARTAALSPARAQAMQDSMLRNAPWTAAQREALREYTYGWAGDVNGLLRNGTDPGPLARRFAQDIHAAMRPLPQAITVHRFVGIDAFGVRDTAQLAKLIGTTVQDRGFMSTSIASSGWTSGEMARAANRRVRIEIEAGAGTPAAYVESLSTHPGQWEVILGAGTRFRIVSVVRDGRNAVVRVRVVP